jgi:hypothetical protein
MATRSTEGMSSELDPSKTVKTHLSHILTFGPSFHGCEKDSCDKFLTYLDMFMFLPISQRHNQLSSLLVFLLNTSKQSTWNSPQACRPWDYLPAKEAVHLAWLH